MCVFLLRLQSALRQLDRAEERAKQKPQKPKKKEFTAMHVNLQDNVHVFTCTCTRKYMYMYM